MGLSPLNHIHKVVDPPAPALRQQKLPVAAPLNTLILATLRGGLASPIASHSFAKD
jgi:hypothetical protein